MPIFMKITHAKQLTGTKENLEEIKKWLAEYNVTIEDYVYLHGYIMQITTSQGEICKPDEWLLLNMRGYFHKIEDELFNKHYTLIGYLDGEPKSNTDRIEEIQQAGTISTHNNNNNSRIR